MTEARASATSKKKRSPIKKTKRGPYMTARMRAALETTQGNLLGETMENLGDPQATSSAAAGAKRSPLDNFFDELKKGSERSAYVRIKRIVDNERAYLVQGGKVLYSEYTGPEFIEKTWGGGNYQVEYYSGGSEPRDRLPRAVEKVDIEGPAKEPAAPAPAHPVAAAPAAPAPDALAGQIAQIMTSTLAPVLTTMAHMLERMQAQAATPPAPAAPPTSLLDLTTALKNLQSLVPTPAAPIAPPAPVNQFDQFREFLTLAKEFTNPGTGEKDPLDFLEKAIDKLGGPLIEHLQNERAQGLPAATQPQPTGAVITMPKNQLQQDLEQLLAFCDKGEPALNLVSIAINMIPEHMLPTLLNLPDPVGALVRFEPRAAQEPYTSWLNELIAGMREELSQDSGS